MRKVFFSTYDPDKRSYKKTGKILSTKKIKVYPNVLTTLGKYFYKDFFIKKNTNGVFITSKLATSKDLFTSHKKKFWITNKFSRDRVHLLRSKHNAILSTSNTILSDNSLLNCRLPGLEKYSPIRLVLDKDLRVSTSSKIALTSKNIKTFFFHNRIDKKKLFKLSKMNIVTIKVNLINDHLDFKEIIKTIRRLNINKVFVEAGLKFNNFLLNNNYIHDFYHFSSGKLLNKNGLYNCENFFLRLNKIKKNKEDILVNLFGDKLTKFELN